MVLFLIDVNKHNTGRGRTMWDMVAFQMLYVTSGLSAAIYQISLKRGQQCSTTPASAHMFVMSSGTAWRRRRMLGGMAGGRDSAGRVASDRSRNPNWPLSIRRGSRIAHPLVCLAGSRRGQSLVIPI